jgi:hypothetical protein
MSMAARAKLELSDVTLQVVASSRQYYRTALLLVQAFDYNADWQQLVEVRKELEKAYSNIPVELTVWPVLNQDAMLAREILRAAIKFCVDAVNGLHKDDYKVARFWAKTRNGDNASWHRFETVEDMAGFMNYDLDTVKRSINYGIIGNYNVISARYYGSKASFEMSSSGSGSGSKIQSSIIN